MDKSFLLSLNPFDAIKYIEYIQSLIPKINNKDPEAILKFLNEKEQLFMLDSSKKEESARFLKEVPPFTIKALQQFMENINWCHVSKKPILDIKLFSFEDLVEYLYNNPSYTKCAIHINDFTHHHSFLTLPNSAKSCFMGIISIETEHLLSANNIFLGQLLTENYYENVKKVKLKNKLNSL